MENHTIPVQPQQQPHYPPPQNQSPNHWKTATIILLLVLLGGIAFWFFKSQPQLTQIQNVFQQKQPTKNTVSEPTTSTNQIISPVSQPQTPKQVPSILYQYENISSRIGQTYQSDVYGKSKSEIDIGYTIGGRFVSSRNKKYLAKWDDTHLEVASAQNLNSFKQIIGTMTQNTRLGQVIFSSDGTKIAFIIAKDLEPDQTFGPTEKNLYIINVDGTNQKLIKQFREPEYVALAGFNVDNNELYWFETEDGGGLHDFTIVNLINGSIKEIKNDLDPDFDFSLDFTSDFSKAYYIKDDKLIEEYTLANDNKRTLYKLDDIGQDKYGLKSEIGGLKLSPNDNMLVFYRRIEPDSKLVIFAINLPSGQIDTLLDDPRYSGTETFLYPYDWSPDGKYIWLETTCHYGGKYYIMDITTKTMNSFLEGKGVKKECLSFITWLNTD